MDGDLRPREARRAAATGASAIVTLRNNLGNLAEVRAPEEAEPPILAPNARQAVFEWLSEINYRQELQAVGLRPRTSALLYGPPGTGKTTLAHHLAQRLGLPLVLVGAEQLMGSLMGESEKNVARLFDTLDLAKAPCVLLLDEIDSIGSKRSDDGSAAGKAKNSILTVLLRKVESHKGLLIAATNRREALDPALWRRFHMQIGVDIPGQDERFAILRQYGAPYAFADEDLDLLVDLTEGASPALLRGLMEGVKRSLILAPRLRRAVDDPCRVFGAIIAALEPPSELSKPPLWTEAGQQALAAFKAWPPARGEATAS
jgi:SpoVK/Ycf46/Vps4 family AAA+-type ATPase